MLKLLTIAILVLCILFSIGVYISPKAVGYADPPRTPTSTPENQELVNLVNELIRDESCVLPCWWGWNIGEDTDAQVQRNADRIWGNKLIIYLDC